MIELTNTLLPNLPENLQWVYGVLYIIEFLGFFIMIISPLYFIFTIKRRNRKKLF